MAAFKDCIMCADLSLVIGEDQSELKKMIALMP